MLHFVLWMMQCWCSWLGTIIIWPNGRSRECYRHQNCDRSDNYFLKSGHTFCPWPEHQCIKSHCVFDKSKVHTFPGGKVHVDFTRHASTKCSTRVYASFMPIFAYPRDNAKANISPSVLNSSSHMLVIEITPQLAEHSKSYSTKTGETMLSRIYDTALLFSYTGTMTVPQTAQLKLGVVLAKMAVSWFMHTVSVVLQAYANGYLCIKLTFDTHFMSVLGSIWYNRTHRNWRYFVFNVHRAALHTSCIYLLLYHVLAVVTQYTCRSPVL